MESKKNLLGYSMIPLIDFFKSINEPKYRAQQLLKWIHQKGVTNFDLMTDFNKPLREKLKSLATLELPKVSKVFKLSLIHI